MSDYTPNPWILDEIKANRDWMDAMMDGMPTECLTSCAKEIESLRAELAKRTEERDEARRDVCHMMHWTGFLAGDYARSRGWDCFKDDKHEVSAEILNFRDIWSAYAHRLRDERDEARREVCVMLEDATNDRRENHAKRWGWDCFKEDSK